MTHSSCEHPWDQRACYRDPNPEQFFVRGGQVWLHRERFRCHLCGQWLDSHTTVNFLHHNDKRRTT